MPLDIGQKAPDFTLPTHEGQTITLSACRGKPVILYFYPKDDTPGCTAEACSFRDLLPRFSTQEAVVIGISKDSVASHKKFHAKYNLNFILASDENNTVCEAYDTWKEKSMYGKKYMGVNRTTFLIDKDGVIRHIWPKVKVEGHGEDVLEALKKV